MPVDLILLAHTNSIIKSKASLASARNKLNPTLNIYHNKIHFANGDNGVSTFTR
jgi:hypothetical protein